MNLKQNLGKRIKELRKLMNFSQEGFAEMVGLERTALAKIESGKSYPKPENLTKIAKALKVDFNILYTFTDTRDNKYDDIVMKLKMLDDKSLENICDIVDALVKKSQR